jgi:hypothetical protein
MDDDQLAEFIEKGEILPRLGFLILVVSLIFKLLW